jgi:hypothetical protein
MTFQNIDLSFWDMLYIAYLAMLSVSQTIVHDSMAVNNGLKRMLKKTVVTYFKVLCWHLPKETEEKRERLQRI